MTASRAWGGRIAGVVWTVVCVFATAAVPIGAAPPPVDYNATLTVAQGVDVPTLDPAVSAGTPAVTVRHSIYEGLVSMNDRGEVEPALATSWSVSADGRTWTFHLRGGVRFQDGTPFDAAAMKRSLDRVRDPKEALPMRNYFVMIQTADAVDASTLRLVTDAPFGPMLQHLAYDGGAAISPPALAKYGKDIASHPVGTGPYRFDSQVPGQSITLVRFDGYWGGRPALAKLVFTAVSEDATRVAQLESNQAQVILNVPPREALRLKQNPALTIVIKDGNRVAHIGMNVSKPPLSDKRVRQALNYAVNRRGLVGGLLDGLGTPSESFVAPITWGYVSQHLYPYDVKKAKQLLAEAGFPNGFDTTIWTPQGRYPLDKETAVAVQGQLAQAGVRARVQVIDWAQYLTLLRRPADQNTTQMYLLAWESVTGEIGYVSRTVFASSQWPPTGWNTMFYRNPRVDELIAQGDRTVDPRTRQPIYTEVQQLVVDDAPWLFLFNYKQAIGTRSDVHGFAVLPYEAIDFRKAWIAAK